MQKEHHTLVEQEKILCLGKFITIDQEFKIICSLEFVKYDKVKNSLLLI